MTEAAFDVAQADYHILVRLGDCRRLSGKAVSQRIYDRVRELVLDVLLNTVDKAEQSTHVALLLLVHLAALLAGAFAVESVNLGDGDDLLFRMSAEVSLHVLERRLVNILVGKAGHIPEVARFSQTGYGVAEVAVVIDGAADLFGDLVTHAAVVLQLRADHFVMERAPVNVAVFEHGLFGVVDGAGDLQIHVFAELRHSFAVLRIETAAAVLLKEGVNAVERAADLGAENEQALAVRFDGEALFAQIGDFLQPGRDAKPTTISQSVFFASSVTTGNLTPVIFSRYDASSSAAVSSEGV